MTQSATNPRRAGPGAPRAPHPSVYLFLFLPFGAGGAFVSVAIAWLASRAGFTDGEVAGLYALYLFPHMWKFLWAPAVDWLASPRRWHAWANLVASLALAGTGLIALSPGHSGLLRLLVFVAGAAATFVCMSTESLAAHLTPAADRGRAASWMQAGNAGGVAVGGLGLVLAERLGFQVAAIVVAVLLAACSLPLLGMRMPAWKGEVAGFRAALRQLDVDVRGVFLSRNGLLALLICVLPVGAGAASNLFAAIATDWRAPPDLVATSNGMLAGFISVLGCAVGGRISDRMGRMGGYLFSGFAMALPAFAMAVGPRSPFAYGAGVLAYYFVIGINYATFCGFALSVIGKGSAATKYNILASLSNVPIYMMTQTDGWVADHWGRTAMLWVDGLATIVAGLVMLVAIVAVRRLARTPAVAESAPTA